MKTVKIALLLFLLTLSLRVTVAAETIRISSGEFAPWTSEELRHAGLTNHLISEAFKLVGYEVEFSFFPWDQAYDVAKDANSFQATSYWYLSDHHDKDYYASDPLQVDRTVFFHQIDSSLENWNTLDDLKGLRIGATRGYTYTPEFWEAEASGLLDIQIADTDEINFEKLVNGEIDLFPTELLTGKQLLYRTYSPQIVDFIGYHRKPLSAPTGHLLISKQLENGEELLVQFNQGLAKLIESGRNIRFQQNMIEGKYIK